MIYQKKDGLSNPEVNGTLLPSNNEGREGLNLRLDFTKQYFCLYLCFCKNFFHIQT